MDRTSARGFVARPEPPRRTEDQSAGEITIEPCLADIRRGLAQLGHRNGIFSGLAQRGREDLEYP